MLVPIFEHGRLEGPLNLTSSEEIEGIKPVIIFAFGFGLSMDDEVFLLSRIKEFRDQGHDNDDSVRLGLQRDRTDHHVRSAARGHRLHPGSSWATCWPRSRC